MRAGLRVGKYVLQRRIAVGGMAEVWAAKAEGPEDFEMAIAMKFILDSFSQDSEYERMFFNEAKTAAQLHHANLVSVFDFDRVPMTADPGVAGRHFIVMELIEGHDLNTICRRAKEADRRIDLGVALYIVGEMLRGLRYLHERTVDTRPLQLVHRDVSPQNVLLSFAGDVKISDFGIAKSYAGMPTQSSSVRGKLRYMAPEQVRGEPASHQTDQFATGIIFWELLAGQQLFDGRNEAEIVDKVRACLVPPLSGFDATIPPAVEQIARRMLDPEPSQRFASTADALKAVTQAPGYDRLGTQLSELMSVLYPPPSQSLAVDQIGPASAQETEVIPELAIQRSRQPPEGRQPGAAAPRNTGRSTAGLPGRTVVPAVPSRRPAVGDTPSRTPVPGPRLLSGERLPLSFAPLPKRSSYNRPPHPEIPESQFAALHGKAQARFVREAAASGFKGDFHDWVLWNARQGIDVMYDARLPADWALVEAWPRFKLLGWKIRLTPMWHGCFPWTSDGFWAAEDLDADEMMPLYARDVGREEFSSVTVGQWATWWRAREVEPTSELPGGTRLPMSARARDVLGDGAPPPKSETGWLSALNQFETDLERRTLQVASIRELGEHSRPEAQGDSTNRSSFWHRMLQLPGRRKKSRPVAPGGDS